MSDIQIPLELQRAIILNEMIYEALSQAETLDASIGRAILLAEYQGGELATLYRQAQLEAATNEGGDLQ